MRALVLALVASVAWAQSTPAPRFRRFTQRTEQGRNTRGLLADSFAFFEFAPASGAGMPAACSSTAPTGAKGEALTFTRTGSATCTKTTSGGLATTGIANGDLVTVAGNVARVEYDSQGVLGLRVESSRTNSALRSQEVSDAIWVKAAAGTGTIPTVTADFATAPDGTTTADRVQFSSCATVGSYSAFSANITTTSPTTSSVYMRAASGTPTVSVCPFNFGTSLGTCSQVTLSTLSWTRFDVPNFAWTTNFNLEIGCENRTASYTGATNSGAADVLVWGIQAEAGAYVTSYIPTTTAAVTRNAEVPSFAITGTSQVISMAATLSPEWAFNNAPSSAVLSMNGANASTLYNPTATDFRFLSGGVNSSGTTPNAATPWRVFAYADGTTTQASWAGTLATAGAAGAAASRWGTTLGVGEGTPAGVVGAINGVLSRVCVDPSPARCR